MHERSVDGDFLLLELRELLKTHRNLKVILMSATINHEVFVKYFDNAPLLTIPGFTHPVEDLYDLLDFFYNEGRTERSVQISGRLLAETKLSSVWVQVSESCQRQGWYAKRLRGGGSRRGLPGCHTNHHAI